MQLKEAVGPKFIMRKQKIISNLALEKFGKSRKKYLPEFLFKKAWFQPEYELTQLAFHRTPQLFAK